MATLRWMGLPEAEVRMVEGTDEKTTARVVVGEGALEEFAMKKLLYADDLTLVANGKQELQETMEEWNGLVTKHGLKLNL